MLTDATGSTNVVRYDYQPFGGELPAGYGGRTATMGYPTIMDTLNPRFTGKNRDSESSLDWFEIRSMSSAQGRFQSVDPGNAGASLGDPQTWNMYADVGNNPLSYTDPSGMCPTCIVFGPLAASGPAAPIVAGILALGIGLFDLLEDPIAGGVAAPPPADSFATRSGNENLCPGGGCEPILEPGGTGGGRGIWDGLRPSFQVFGFGYPFANNLTHGVAPRHYGISANNGYEGSKRQLCDKKSQMAALEEVVPGIQHVLNTDYSLDTPKDLFKERGPDFVQDKALEWAGKSTSLLAFRGITAKVTAKIGAYGGKGVPMSVTSAGLRWLGWAGAAYTAFDAIHALRTEFKVCMEN